MVDDAQLFDERHDAAELVARRDGLAGQLGVAAYLVGILVVLEPCLDDSLVGFLVDQMDLELLVEEHILAEVHNLEVVHNLAEVAHSLAEVRIQVAVGILVMAHIKEVVLLVHLVVEHIVLGVEHTVLEVVEGIQVGLGIVTSVVALVVKDILMEDSLVVGTASLVVVRLTFFLYFYIK